MSNIQFSRSALGHHCMLYVRFGLKDRSGAFSCKLLWSRQNSCPVGHILVCPP